MATHAKKVKSHFCYDSEEDILSMHKGFDEGESFMGNREYGDIILDISTKGRVRGVEIMNATEFLQAHSARKSWTGIQTGTFTLKSGNIIMRFIFGSNVRITVEAPIHALQVA